MTDVKEMAEIAKKRAELAKKRDAAERKLKTQDAMLKERIRTGKETGIKAIDVKYAANEVARLNKELDRLK